MDLQIDFNNIFSLVRDISELGRGEVSKIMGAIRTREFYDSLMSQQDSFGSKVALNNLQNLRVEDKTGELFGAVGGLGAGGYVSITGNSECESQV